MDISLHAEKLAIRTPFTPAHNLVQCFRGVKAGQLDYNCPVDFLSAGLQRATEPDIWHMDIVLALCTDESAPLRVNNAYIGSNHGEPCGVAVTASAHGKTVADVGSLWQDALGVKWTLMRVMSPDRLLFVSENIGVSETDYAFADKIHGELVYISHGVHTDAVTVESQGGSVQLYRAARFLSRDLYYYKEGVRYPVTGYHTDCDSAELVEEYDVINPATVAEALRAARPEDGYAAEPDLAIGTPMLRYRMIYHVLGDGTVLCDFEHTRLQDVTWTEHMGLMYQSKCDVYGGGIWRYIPKTKPFALDGESYDFSVPRDTTVEPFPKSLNMTAEHWTDPAFPPDRQIDFIRRPDGSAVAAFAGGFLPLYDGDPAVRREHLSKSLLLIRTRKTYPYIASGDYSMDRVRGIGYKKYFPQADPRHSLYSVACDGKTYVYADFFGKSKSEVVYDLPTDVEPEQLELGGDVSWKVRKGQLVASGKRGYAVFCVKS
ncbi:MAG: hypothetical protein IJC17_04665 [Clostridia bacterium]|nr:hypothetical protein [Clostridia bacterium]